jgi:hypothetical protein
MYPLFHRKLRDNSERPSANPLKRKSFTSEPRKDANLMEHSFYEFFASLRQPSSKIGEIWNSS